MLGKYACCWCVIARVRNESTVHRISDSCGYGVPLLRFEGERDQLDKWAEKRGAEGIAAYKKERNRQSLDGLPGLRNV